MNHSCNYEKEMSNTKIKKQDNPLIKAIDEISWILFIAWGAVHLAFLALDIGLPRIAKPISFTIFAICCVCILFCSAPEVFKDKGKDRDKNKNLRISKRYREYREHKKIHKSSLTDRIESVVFFVVISIFIGTIFLQTFEDDSYCVFGEDYATALRIIDAHFIYEIDLEAMHHQVMRVLASELDEWSIYMTAEEYENWMQSMGNRFYGIGV